MNDNKTLVLRLARLLHPLCDLGPHYQMVSFKGARTLKLEPHIPLRAEQQQAWLTFLLDGEIDITHDRGEIEQIKANTPRAKKQLFNVFPKGTVASSANGAILLRILRSQYLLAMSKEPPSRFSAANSNLYERIYHAYQNEHLELPSLKDNVIKIRYALKNPNTDHHTISQMLLNEPVLSAKLIQAANSALFAHSSPVRTVRDAITRIGLTTAYDIVLAQSMKGLFNSQSSNINQRLQKVYQHSTLIASLAYILARNGPSLNKEKALLAGLLHDIGVIPILTFIDKENLLDEVSDEEIQYAVLRLRGIIGGTILQQMGFEDWVVAAAEEAEVWNRDIDGDADYADVINLAHLHSILGTPMMKRLPHIDDISAFDRLEVGEFDPATGFHVLQEAEEITQAIMRALN
jgi:HD-like signal output (HDOD) protein